MAGIVQGFVLFPLAQGSARCRGAEPSDAVRRLHVHRLALVDVDPNRHAAEAARLRAETTSQVLAAQQSAADAADDAARARDEIVPSALRGSRSGSGM